jgi:hypothetical protein
MIKKIIPIITMGFVLTLAAMGESFDYSAFVGEPLDEVERKLETAPRARFKAGRTTILQYDTFEISATDGIVSRVTQKADTSTPSAVKETPGTVAATSASRTQSPNTTATEPVRPNPQEGAFKQPLRAKAIYYGSIAIEFDDLDFATSLNNANVETLNSSRARSAFRALRKEFRKYSLPALQKSLDTIYYAKSLTVDNRPQTGIVIPGRKAICITGIPSLHTQIGKLILSRHRPLLDVEAWEALHNKPGLKLLKLEINADAATVPPRRLAENGIIDPIALNGIEDDFIVIWQKLMTNKTGLMSLAEDHPLVAERVNLVIAFLAKWSSTNGGSLADTTLNLIN